jgi:hypothetical protein
MPWLLPLIAALFWFDSYRPSTAMPPYWVLRTFWNIGMLAWTGPVAYWVLAEAALANGLTTPWIWPARPPADRGGAICAYLVFAAGLALITVRGVRESARNTTT